MLRADVDRGAIEAGRAETGEPARVRLGSGGVALLAAKVAIQLVAAVFVAGAEARVAQIVARFRRVLAVGVASCVAFTFQVPLDPCSDGFPQKFDRPIDADD